MMEINRAAVSSNYLLSTPARRAYKGSLVHSSHGLPAKQRVVMVGIAGKDRIHHTCFGEGMFSICGHSRLFFRFAFFFMGTRIYLIVCVLRFKEIH